MAEVGDPEAAASVKSWPVPLSATLCVLPAAPWLLSVMLSVPVSGPVAAGEKVTLIVQEPPAATLPPQLLVSPKLALMARLVMVSGALPVLLRVTGCDPLVVPAFWLPNVRLGGETPATGVAAAPVKPTVCGLSEALSVTVKVAVTVPAAPAVKVTSMVQLAPAAKLEPQLLVWAKHPAPVPLMAMLLIFADKVLVFCKVTV